LQTPWKVLLGLLGAAALVTIITVPVVLLNKGSKFETFEKDKVVGDGARCCLSTLREARNVAGDLDQCTRGQLRRLPRDYCSF
jgi:hypothetical protein